MALHQATTKLASHSNETSKDKLSIIINWLSIIVNQLHAKLHNYLFISTCSLHWIIKSSWEIYEKKVYGDKHTLYWIDIYCRCTLELPQWGHLLLLSNCTPNYTITCSFLHADYTETLKSRREICGKKFMVTNTLYWIDIQYRCTLELHQWGNSNAHQQHMLVKLRRHILKYTLNNVSCPLALPLLNI